MSTQCSPCLNEGIICLTDDSRLFLQLTMKASLWIRAAVLLWCLTQNVLGLVQNSTMQFQSILDKYWDKDETWWQARPRGRRAISEGDLHLILDLHNKLRGQVHPPASNMEHMVSEDAARGTDLLLHLEKQVC